jgi:hypothetical protein
MSKRLFRGLTSRGSNKVSADEIYKCSTANGALGVLVVLSQDSSIA